MIYQSVPGRGKLSLEGDPALNYRRFVRGWIVYEVGAHVKEQDATLRASILQSYLSAEVLELLETLIMGRMPIVYSMFSKPISLVLQMKRMKDTISTHVPKRKVNPLILS